MRLLEKSQSGEINKYDQVLAYYKDHHIELFFKAWHAKILLRGEAADARRVDILFYVLDATGEAQSRNIGAEGTEATACWML